MLLDAASFPLILAGLDQVTAKYAATARPGRAPTDYAAMFKAALDAVNAADAAGGIRNVEFKELKDTLNRLLDVAGQTADFRFQDPHFWYRDIHGSSTAVKKFSPQNPMLGYAKEAVLLKNALETFKDRLIAGRAPNPNAKPVFVPQKATNSVLSVISDTLREQIASTKAEFVKQNTAQKIKVIREFMVEHVEDQKANQAPGFISFLLHQPGVSKTPVRIGTMKGKHPRYGYDTTLTLYGYELLPNWEVAIEKFVQAQADMIEAEFVSKNTRKLGAIIEQRGDFKEAKTTRCLVNRGAIEATTLVTFQDGASFTVDNKVVYKWAPVSKRMFAQYPATFHDVRFGDGTKLARPSEERMNKFFKKA